MARPVRIVAADIIAFIETGLSIVPEGKYVGQPLRLQDWQKISFALSMTTRFRAVRGARLLSMPRKMREDRAFRGALVGASVRTAGA